MMADMMPSFDFLSYNGNVTVSVEHSGLSLSAVRRRQGLSKSFADAKDS